MAVGRKEVSCVPYSGNLNPQIRKLCLFTFTDTENLHPSENEIRLMYQELYTAQTGFEEQNGNKLFHDVQTTSCPFEICQDKASNLCT